MPRSVALLSLVAGAAVVVFGVAYARIASNETTPPPSMALQPVPSGGQSGAPSDSTDVVHGKVVQSGGGAVAGARVVLRPQFDGGKKHETRTDADGDFEFVRAGVTPGTPYVAEVAFDGVMFPSEVLRSPRPLDAPARIVVAPTTKSAKALSIRVESIAVVGDKDGLQALHVLTVRNNGKRAYVGGLHLPFLRNGTAIDPGSGLVRSYLSIRGSEIISRAPVVPGNTDITYTYVAPMGTPRLDTRYTFPYPVKRFELLVGTGLRADAVGNLKKESGVQLGTGSDRKTYARLAASDLGAGDAVRLRIAPKTKNAVLTYGAIVAAILLSILVLTFPIVRRIRRRPNDTETPAPLDAFRPGALRPPDPPR